MVSGSLAALSFSPDSQFLYTAGYGSHPPDNSIKTWDISTAAQQELPRPALATSTLSSPLIATVSMDGKLTASAPRPVIPFPVNRNALLTDSRKNVITVWDEKWNVLVQSAELAGPVQWLSFSSDGRRLAACVLAQEGELQSAAQLSVLDATSGVEQLSLRLPVIEKQRNFGSGPEVNYLLPNCLFSPDGRRLLALINAGTGKVESSYIKAWEIDSKREIWQSPAVSDPFDRIVISPDGERLVAFTSDRQKFSVWAAADGRMLWSARDKAGIRGLDFSPDGLVGIRRLTI